jgi:hypothetical protein
MEPTQELRGYIDHALKIYRSDKRKYGEDVAGHNLYVNTRAIVDPAWREKYGGWDTRYRRVA